ncbi:MAG: MBL fold metallo-hydrolase RNA specificity domain-containing protein [Steroidobacterales bacterium]
MKLSFHGADQDVTGSCHLLEADGRRILVDCGLFQGSRTLAAENAGEFGFDARSIDLVMLTHAHLDHCGRLPLLVKRGFRGEILATAATRDLTTLVLQDAARLHAEDALHNHEEPLYTPGDAAAALALCKRSLAYGESTPLAPNLSVTLYDAGHILGSASLRFELSTQSGPRSIVFSGDLGNSGRALLRDPVAPPPADVVVMETTYGDRLHRSLERSVDELWNAVGRALGRGGNVVIPTFALERAQEILFYLRTGIEAGRIPTPLGIFVDSPMAISATELFRKHREALSPAIAAEFAAGRDPLRPPRLEFTRDHDASLRINSIAGGAVILAGSGMATGGRVLHHLQRELPHAHSAVVFVGFAARGTPARQIIDGARSVRLYHDSVAVRAEIHTINGFSAHADRGELLSWHQRVRPRRTFLVHGEKTAMAAFAASLPPGTETVQPEIGQEFEL